MARTTADSCIWEVSSDCTETNNTKTRGRFSARDIWHSRTVPCFINQSFSGSFSCPGAVSLSSSISNCSFSSCERGSNTALNRSFRSSESSALLASPSSVSIVEKVIVGAKDDEGNIDPYKVTFVFKTGFHNSIGNAKMRFGPKRL